MYLQQQKKTGKDTKDLHTHELSAILSASVHFLHYTWARVFLEPTHPNWVGEKERKRNSDFENDQRKEKNVEDGFLISTMRPILCCRGRVRYYASPVSCNLPMKSTIRKMGLTQAVTSDKDLQWYTMLEKTCQAKWDCNHCQCQCFITGTSTAGP